jgi:hypothetical protein
MKNIVTKYQVELWEEEKGMETILPQKNLIQNSQGNEENGNPVLDSKKTKINEPRNPIMSTRTTSKKKSSK